MIARYRALISHRSLVQAAATDRFLSSLAKTTTSTTTHNETEPAIVEVSSAGNQVHIVSEGVSTSFHAQWLWANDPVYFHPTSGQRTRSPISFFGWKIIKADIINGRNYDQHRPSQNDNGKRPLLPYPQWSSFHPTDTVYQLARNRERSDAFVRIRWKHRHSRNEAETVFNLGWLLDSRYDYDQLDTMRKITSVTRENAISCSTELKSIDFDFFACPETREEARFILLHEIVDRGAVIIKNVSHSQVDKEETVGYIARELSHGSLSHGSLYGDIFHVQSASNAHNIAYTNVSLPPHQDMAYYASKPGLQFLHCVNNRGVHGGESTLVDSLAAADFLRETAPILFDTLCHYEATFVKQRRGADMVYKRRHIETSSNGEIVAVHWSPPFEGPLRIEPDYVDEYFVARAAFEIAVDRDIDFEADMLPIDSSIIQKLKLFAKEYTWQKALNMGEVLVFNNQRMLHGRKSFSVLDGEHNGRHLVGCYTDIDDTLSAYRQLRRESPTVVSPFVRNFGNGSLGEK